VGFRVSEDVLRDWCERGLVAPEAVGLPAPKPLEAPPMAEKDFQRDVERFARRNGWKVYHTRDSRKSEPGFPDIVMIRSPRLIVAELKTDTGQPTEEQLEWLEAFRAAGVPAFLWRPSDWSALAQTLGDERR
jgi:hypothetical protein